MTRSILFDPKRWFRAQRAERVVHVPTSIPGLDYDSGVLKMSWEARPYPGVGTGNYAFEGTVLPATDMLGTGHKYRPYMVTQPAKLVQPSTVIQGGGVNQGTFYQQPLYQAKGG